MRDSMSQVENHSTPVPPSFFKGRIQKSKYMDYWKNMEEGKSEFADDRRNLKQKRVFGTQRNTNVAVKPKSTEKKSTRKSCVDKELKSLKQPEQCEVENVKHDEVSQKNEVSRDEEADEDARVETEVIENVEVNEKEKDEEKHVEEQEIEVNPKKKKSVGFQEKVDEEEVFASASAPRTPVQLSSSLRKPRRSGTPYHTAQNCRRCKLVDKLESPSYWIEQIKLAESVGKHFVSVAFFQLAKECNIESDRSLKMELKRYLSRHVDLGKEKEWIEALRNYGLPVPKENNTTSRETVHSSNLFQDEPNAITCSHVPKESHTA